MKEALVGGGCCDTLGLELTHCTTIGLGGPSTGSRALLILYPSVYISAALSGSLVVLERGGVPAEEVALMELYLVPWTLGVRMGDCCVLPFD